MPVRALVRQRGVPLPVAIETYERLFHCPLDALWIAYESLTMFRIVHPDLKAGDMQYFYYKKHLFVMKCIAKQSYYYTPDGQ